MIALLLAAPASPAHAQDARAGLCWWTGDVERCRNIIIAELGWTQPLLEDRRAFTRTYEQSDHVFVTELRAPRMMTAELGMLLAVRSDVAVGGTLQFFDGGVQLAARARHELAGAAFIDAKLGFVRARRVTFEEGLGGDGRRRGFSAEARVGLHRWAALGLRYDDFGWPDLPGRAPPEYRWIDDAPSRQRSLAGVVALEPPGTVAASIILVLLGSVAIILLSGLEG